MVHGSLHYALADANGVVTIPTNPNRIFIQIGVGAALPIYICSSYPDAVASVGLYVEPVYAMTRWGYRDVGDLIRRPHYVQVGGGNLVVWKEGYCDTLEEANRY